MFSRLPIVSITISVIKNDRLFIIVLIVLPVI